MVNPSCKIDKRDVTILLGPTAVGKTAVSIPLARECGCEIISADSRQGYIGLDIGTAKPSETERAGIPHHLIDIVTINSPFTVADFQRLAFETLDLLHAQNKAAIVVGGTGLYIRALVDRPSYQDQPPLPEFRREILDEIVSRGTQPLYDELKRVDPDAAAKIHPNNIPRLVRAIEVVRLTGRPFTEAVHRDKSREDESSYRWHLVGLNMDRKDLYERINKRVTDMFNDGWVTEVKTVLQNGATGDEKPLQGLGYRDVIKFIKGEQSFDETLDLIQRDTRRFAKRQMTFFKMLPGIKWIDLNPVFDPDEVAREVVKLVKSENQ
jgi:tRNA dimethylallyltransferase